MSQEESSLPDPRRNDSPERPAYADLHLHTSASDGILPPADVVRLAAREGFSAISICDHDTVAGLEEAFDAAAKQGVELITGVELSTYLGETEVHILGYCFDREDTSLLSALRGQCGERLKRVEEMIRLLREQGIALDRSSIDEEAAFGSVGRLHLARALVEQGFVTDTKQAFARYIGRGKAAYVPRAHLSPREACQAIKQARGIPVLAHPSQLNGDELIPGLIDQGIMGIEAFYSKAAPEVADHYCHLAEKRGLLITGGSDSHQGVAGERLLGTIKLDYCYVEKLKEAAASLLSARTDS